MSKIAVCYFTYNKDLDFLNESLKVLENTIKKHPEHEVKVFVYDDSKSKPCIKKKEIYGKPTLIKTKFDRKGNLNGFECINGMFIEYKKISETFDYDYLVKIDSDCVLNSFNYIKIVEDFITENNLPLDKLSQFGSYFADICVVGCCQTFTKLGIHIINSVFDNMNNSNDENIQILKKRVSLGYNEDKVVGMLLDMSPSFRVNIDKVPGLKGNCNAFISPQDTDYSQYTSVAFKPNYFIPVKDWDREKSLTVMKNYSNNVK